MEPTVTARLPMAELFRSVVELHPSRPALVAPGARLSFAGLGERTDKLACRLRARGVVAGTVVGVLLVDGLAMIELLIATAKLGATILTMNWRLAAAELRLIIDDADPAIMFASDCFEALAREAGPDREILVVGSDDPAGAGGGLDRDADAVVVRAPCQDLVSNGNWLLLYSSGTTGRPKGVLHGQEAYRVNSLALLERLGFTEVDRALLIQPLFHVGGLHVFLAAHAAGACVIVPERGINHEGMLRQASAEAATFQTIPALDPRGYSEAHRRLALPMRLRLLHGGGGMHPPELLRELGAAFGADMMLGYGQSEGGGIVTLISLAEQLVRPNSCGRPLKTVFARIVDAEGDDVPAGDVGELLLRGPSTMTGYLNLPDATAAALTGSWLRSGDLFRRDDEGYFYFAGRTKELIKTGGENVYPAEVEAVLAEHPAVAQCCVVGVADARFGEAVKAFVVLAGEERPPPSEIADRCRGRIAGYKRPRFVEFINAIPCDFQGKPQRTALGRMPVTPDQATDR